MKPSTRGPIVAATDPSPASDRVLRASAAMAAATGMPLHVIHALDFPPSPYLDRQAAEPTFLGRVEAARGALQRQIARAVPPGVAVADTRLEIYAAHRAIDEYAGAVSAGLVVIGPHTHDTWRRSCWAPRRELDRVPGERRHHHRWRKCVGDRLAAASGA